MARQSSRRSQSRIAEVDLVKGASVLPEISEGFAKFAAGITCFAVLVTLGLVLIWSYKPLPLIILAPLTIFSSVLAAHLIDGSTFAAHLHEWFIVPRRRLPLEHPAPYGRTTRASGLTAGSWAYLEREYTQLRREYSADYGRSAGQPDVPYRLVIATYPLDGNHQVVAFSDGTSTIWHRSSNVIVDTCPEVERTRQQAADEGAEDTAKALQEIIEILDGKEAAESILGMAGWLGEHQRDTVARALEVAKWWNLIEYHLLWHGDEIYDSEVLLTQAGQDWHLSSSKFQRVRDVTRRTVQRESGESPRINIGTFAGIMNVGKDISGTHTAAVHQELPTDAQLLSCLRQVLDLQEIPWSEPSLARVKQVMERAIAQQDPRISGMKQAVTKLKEICGDVAVGVLGNGAYQTLLHYFT